MKIRDFQKIRVYRAGWNHSLYKVSLSGQDAIKLVDGILKDSWFRRQFPHILTVRIKYGDFVGSSCTTLKSGYYRLKLSSRQGTLTILHEIAHCCTNDGHGPEFANAFLLLVERYYPKAYNELRINFIRCGVQIAHSVPTAAPVNQPKVIEQPKETHHHSLVEVRRSVWNPKTAKYDIIVKKQCVTCGCFIIGD